MNDRNRYFREDGERFGFPAYEVSNDEGTIGYVYSLTGSKVGPSQRCWVAELEGEVVGSARNRYAAARLLGVGRDVPHVKKPKGKKGKKVSLGHGQTGSLFDDDGTLTFVSVQPVIIFGTDAAKQGERPVAKAERRKAAEKVLADNATMLDAAGVTAKVGKDGFVHLSPLALERLLALVAA